MIAAARIRHAIKLSGVTQKEIAGLLSISEVYLAHICEGKCAVSAFVAVRVEDILHVDAHKILIDQTLYELRQARAEYKPEKVTT